MHFCMEHIKALRAVSDETSVLVGATYLCEEERCSGADAGLPRAPPPRAERLAAAPRAPPSASSSPAPRAPAASARASDRSEPLGL